MKRVYLGDSYDAVKRLWQQALTEWAPLYVEPQFIPKDIQAEYTCAWDNPSAAPFNLNLRFFASRKFDRY